METSAAERKQAVDDALATLREEARRREQTCADEVKIVLEKYRCTIVCRLQSRDGGTTVSGAPSIVALALDSPVEGADRAQE